MSRLTTTALLATAITIATAPAAFAQTNNGTTLGGNAKDNSASGGSEASGTSKEAGGTMAKKKKTSGGTMMKKSGAMSGAAGK